MQGMPLFHPYLPLPVPPFIETKNNSCIDAFRQSGKPEASESGVVKECFMLFSTS